MMGKQGKLFVLFFLISIKTVFAAASDSRALEANAYQTYMSPALSRLINQMINQNKYRDAVNKLDEELSKDPNNTSLLYKKASLEADMEQWKNSKNTLDKLISLNPQNAEAIKLREKVETIRQKEPHNEIGIDEDIAYVSDLKAYWQYTSLYYHRLTDVGSFGGRVNYSKRLGSTGEQYQAELYPQFTNNFYGDLILGYANTTQILFPNLQYRLDAYYNTSNGMEFSLGQGGQKYIRFSNQKIFVYTGTIGKYYGNWYFWLRPSYYTPKSVEYTEIAVRKYFSDANNYLGIILGAGRLPDIGNLPPIDQMLIMKQKSVAVNGQVSLSKSIFLKLRAGYAKQQYPNLLRNITDGDIGFIFKI